MKREIFSFDVLTGVITAARGGKATKWKRNTERHPSCENARAKERGRKSKRLGPTSIEFQVDDKARMTGVQCRGEVAPPTGDEFLIAGTVAQMQCQGGAPVRTSRVEERQIGGMSR